MRLFWDKGFVATSMSDLTAAMGIASPSLYAAFGSKEDLYREALERYQTLYGDNFWGSLDRSPTAREAIEAVLRLSVQIFTCPDNPSGCMAVVGASQTDDLSADLARDLRAMRTGSAEAMEARIRRDMDAGVLPADVDARAVADFYATVHRGLTVSVRSGADAAELTSVVNSAMAAWDALTRSR